MDKDDDEPDETTGKVRFPCLPSLIALRQMRNHLHIARGGRRLMKWSALASGRELRRISKDITIIYDSFAEDVRNAFILIARCRYFYPNINKMVVQNHPPKACVTVGRSYKSIAGSKITTYAIEDNCPDSYPLLGIDKGGEVIQETKRAWHELLRRVIAIEQLRSNFITLDASHNNATKKQNVLEKVVIPRTLVTIQYILSELEELAREEFFRIKKIQEVKNRSKKKKKKEPCAVCAEEEKEPPETELPLRPPPPPVSCILCEGPMHVEGQHINPETAILTHLKKNLGKVLDATVKYEKSAKEEAIFDAIVKAFDQKLRKPPVCIPNSIDVEKLCDLCKDMYAKQQGCTDCADCCDKPVSRGSSKSQPTLKKKESKVSIKEPCEMCAREVASLASNTPSSGQRSFDVPLGVIETEEITEIIRVRNPDGTFSEKRRIITIRRNPGIGPSSSATSGFRNNRSVGHVVVHHRKGLMEKFPKDVHSDYAMSSPPMVDCMVKECMSSNFADFDEILESITEFAPRHALETYSHSQTSAAGMEMGGLIYSGSAPINDLELDDDDSLHSRTSKEKLASNSK